MRFGRVVAISCCCHPSECLGALGVGIPYCSDKSGAGIRYMDLLEKLLMCPTCAICCTFDPEGHVSLLSTSSADHDTHQNAFWRLRLQIRKDFKAWLLQITWTLTSSISLLEVVLSLHSDITTTRNEKISTAVAYVNRSGSINVCCYHTLKRWRQHMHK